jgi:uncharacterized heparinase superfamily protein
VSEIVEWPTATDAVARADRVLEGEFRFLNHTEHLSDIDWRRRYNSHLWSYNLHYFDYAFDLACAWCATGDSRYCDRFVELALSWIDGTDPGRGDGWEPYAVSLRLVNWIYALLLFGDALGPFAHRRIETSLAAQAEFLSRRLELHILANHLQKNLKALALAGLYFEGTTAARWLRDGSRGVWRELMEQVLPDGVQYERSPMYHAIALSDFLEVALLERALDRAIPDDTLARLREMATCTPLLGRPDGTLHLFNDAANGIAPDRTWIMAMAGRLFGALPAPTPGPFELSDAGYYGWRSTDTSEALIVDCGEPGPSYQPAHAHCDILSFELDLGGRPIIVDSGVSGYDTDRLREYVRSTRAHNTVMVAGREQSEVWGTFRVARRARPGAVRQHGDSYTYRFEASCMPFWSGSVRHHRRIERAGGGWIITDRIEGGAGDRIDSFIHIHPELTVSQDGSIYMLSDQELYARITVFGIDRVRVLRGESDPAQGWYCPEFGVSLPAATLQLTVDHNQGQEFGYRIAAIR